MRLRTLFGLLGALALAVGVVYLAGQNDDLLTRPFQLSGTSSIPVYAALLVVFLLGLLPAATVLMTQTLQRDLARRRRRRRHREVKSLQGTFRRALDFQADSQWGKAAAELEGVLAEKPEDFATLLAYGEVLRHQGRSNEALEVHRRASVLYPRSVAVLYQLAEDYEVAGDVEVARQIRDRVLRDFPGRGLQVLRRRRNAALGRKDWREAGRLQERVEAMLAESGATIDLEREAGVATGLAYQAGVDHLEAERLDEAEQVFRNLLDGSSRFLPARIMLGEVELVRGSQAAAVSIWREGFVETGSPVFLQRIEDHFIESGDPVAGIETLQQLAAAAASPLLPRFFLGRFYARLEMHEEALKILTGLEDRLGRTPGFHALLGQLHGRRGEMRQAVDSLLAAVTEAGIASVEYGCRVCRMSFPDWRDRCDFCGSWSSVELRFDEDLVENDRASRTAELYHGDFQRPDES